MNITGNKIDISIIANLSKWKIELNPKGLFFKKDLTFNEWELLGTAIKKSEKAVQMSL